MKNITIICNITTKNITEKISIMLIKKKLSSCISIIKNIQFIYIYKKKICKENKYKMLINTTTINKIKIITEIKNIQKEKQIFIIKNTIT